MSAESALYSRLSGDATLAALVGTRIYPNIAPQNATYPNISFRRVSDGRFSSMGTDAGVVRSRWQFDVWSQSIQGYTDALAVRNALRAALQRYRGTSGGTVIADIFILTQIDLYEDETAIHHLVLDAEVIYQE